MDFLANMLFAKGLPGKSRRAVKSGVAQTREVEKGLGLISSDVAKDIKNFNKQKNFSAIHHCKGVTDLVKFTYQMVENAHDLLHLSMHTRMTAPLRAYVGKRLKSLRQLNRNTLSKIDSHTRVLDEGEEGTLASRYEALRLECKALDAILLDSVAAFLPEEAARMEKKKDGAAKSKGKKSKKKETG